MFTPEGMELVWAVLSGQSEDSLVDGTIRVSNGSETAVAMIEELTIDGASLRVTSTFGEDQANHDWSRRELVSRDGVILDIEESDGGRKVPGMVWTVEVGLDLTTR